MKRKLIAILLSATMAFSMSVNTFAYTFRDTQKFSKEIEEVTDLGFIFYGDIPYFEPDTIVTRYSAIETMYILANTNLSPSYGHEYYEETVYPDSHIGYYNYTLNFLVENNVLDGIVLKTFKKNSPVTYGEMVTMLVRTLNLHENININVAQDTQESYIEVALQLGLLDGLEFEKDDFINHESLAKLVYNSLRQPLPNSNVSLMESSFKDLYANLETIQNNISYLNKIMSNPKSAEEISEDDLVSRLQDIVYILYKVGYSNENFASKQELKLDETYMSTYISYFLEEYNDFNYVIKFSDEIEDYINLKIYIKQTEEVIQYMFLEDYEEVEYGKDISTNLHKRLSVIMSEKLSYAKQILKNNPVTSYSVDTQIKEVKKLIEEGISLIEGFDESTKDLGYYEALMDTLLSKYEYVAMEVDTTESMLEELEELYFLVAELYYVIYEMEIFYTNEGYELDIDLEDYEYLKEFEIYKDTALSLYKAVESLIDKL